MKPLQFFLFVLLIQPFFAFAQAPQGVNYQAVARYQGVVLVDDTFDVRISIFDGVGGTNLVYRETHVVHTNQFGLFNLAIGNGVPDAGMLFTDVDWSSGDEQMEVEIDNGNGYVSLGSKTFWSVPYSLHSETAGRATNMGADDLTDVDTAGLVIGDRLEWDGTTWIPVGGTITDQTSAGGDLSGNYPDPTVTRIQGMDVSNTTPFDGEVLKWDSINGIWIPSSDNVASSGSGAVNTTARIAGDGSTTMPLDLAQQGASIGQVLKWTGAQWYPADDSVNADGITIGFPASGDLTGFYPSPTVARIRNTLVSSATPFANQVLKFNNGQWIPSTDEVNDPDSDPSNELQTMSIVGNILTLSGGGGSVNLPSYNFGAGFSVIGNTVINTGDLNPNDDVLIGSSAGGDLGGTYPNPVVTKIHGRNIANSVPNDGWVYKWNMNANEWQPSPDDDTDPDSDPNNEIQTLSISGSLISLSNGGGSVSLPTYMGGAGISVFGTTIVNTGDLNPNDDITFGSAAGGDLGGIYPNPTVAGLNGNPISNTLPGNNQVLKWNGSQWVPAPDNNTVYTGGVGIDVIGATIINTGDTDGSDDITSSTAAGGDLIGTFPTPTVKAIQGFDVSSSTPNTGEVLKWNGTQWEPDSDNSITYVGGAGINIVGSVITNTGDLDDSDDITVNSNAGGDVAGLFPSLTVTALQGNVVSSSSPITGQSLVWNGSAWAPSTISSSPWTTTGADISYSTGNVGINTTSPTSPLSVNGTSTIVNATNDIRVEMGTNSDGGFVQIYNNSNILRAGMRINASGLGEFFGDVKNFRIDHPTQPENEIWYASLEGPEAAAYVRGTATLVNGEVSIEFDEHFQLVSNPESMTVILTPLSADSKGLAVVEKTETGISVKELFSGKGNYSFDWEVKCVRRGHENFQVIRPKQ